MVTLTLPIEIIALGLSFLLGLVCYFFRNHDNKIAENTAEIDELRIMMANDFMKKTEYERFERALLKKLDRIESKQDNLFFEIAKKQDKT